MTNAQKIESAEIRARMQAKFYSLSHALNDNKLWVSLDICRDVIADFTKLKEIIEEEIRTQFDGAY